MTLGWCCRECDKKDILDPKNAPHSCGPARPLKPMDEFNSARSAHMILSGGAVMPDPPTVPCSQCGMQMRQVSAIELKVGGVLVEIRRTDGLAGAGQPPFVCEPCIKAELSARS